VHRRTPSKFAQSLENLKEGALEDELQAGPSIPPSEEDLAQVQQLANVVLQQHQTIPTENDILAALAAIETAARKATGLQQSAESANGKDTSPASAILSLDSRPTAPSPSTSTIPTSTIDTLSTTAYHLLIHQSVDITAPILERYVIIQSLLSRPASFPSIFDLYRTKPIASTNRRKPSTLTYDAPKQDSPTTAIPPSVANLALTAALRTHSLPLALSIIDTSFSAPPFRRNKLLRQALPPFVGAAAAPFALYTLASSISSYQNMLPTENFTAIAFAGMLTYTTAIGTIGYVALTTSNDQMERITWATGLPLWQRWAREEERAAVDRVARAFGFREKWRWGEEEGEEWDELREWTGERGMVLDKIGLMEGME